MCILQLNGTLQVLIVLQQTITLYVLTYFVDLLRLGIKSFWDFNINLSSIDKMYSSNQIVRKYFF